MIPTKLIKNLESTNCYDDRIKALSTITTTYVNDPTNFLILSKKINEFIVYLFGLSQEEPEMPEESIAFE